MDNLRAVGEEWAEIIEDIPKHQKIDAIKDAQSRVNAERKHAEAKGKKRKTKNGAPKRRTNAEIDLDLAKQGLRRRAAVKLRRVAEVAYECALDRQPWAVQFIAERLDGRLDVGVRMQGDVRHQHEHSYIYETFEEARDRLLQDGIDIERMPQLADLRAEEEAVLEKIAREGEAMHGMIEGEVVEASGDADAPVQEPDTAPAPDGPKKPPDKPDAPPQAPPRPSRFG